ncbi:MAG: zinc ABC transporter substrate-binding protein, partial [Actinobacteria bacterium]|nr:zinc ABC transporter substrate-binding protein [Actinomycetota bacterium]
TTILGDVARQVVGDHGRVEVLMPVGADPHSFQASAAQAASLRGADLVVVNGAGLEGGLHDVVAAAAAEGVAVVEAASFVVLLSLDHEGEDREHEGEGEERDDHDSLDPHIWTDPSRMAEVATGLGEALAAARPACATAYRAAAAAYAGELLGLDAEIEATLAAVPPEQRKLLTNHHALGYFADRYGFEVIGAIIPGGATLAEPSAADLAGLVDLLRRAGVRAIFAETTRPAGLAEALAAELGGRVAVVSLYTGSLGEPGSGADTYPGMQRTNAERIAAALVP